MSSSGVSCCTPFQMASTASAISGSSPTAIARPSWRYAAPCLQHLCAAAIARELPRASSPFDGRGPQRLSRTAAALCGSAGCCSHGRRRAPPSGATAHERKISKTTDSIHDLRIPILASAERACPGDPICPAIRPSQAPRSSPKTGPMPPGMSFAHRRRPTEHAPIRRHPSRLAARVIQRP